MVSVRILRLRRTYLALALPSDFAKPGSKLKTQKDCTVVIESRVQYTMSGAAAVAVSRPCRSYARQTTCLDDNHKTTLALLTRCEINQMEGKLYYL